MRMIPVEEIKSIDVDNSEKDLCPFGMSLGDQQYCATRQCMAWYWTGDDVGCCALVYKPETIQFKK